MVRAHRALGLEPTYAFRRLEKSRRLRVRDEIIGGVPSSSAGYIPSIEYLNYLLPAVALRKRCAAFDIIQLATADHAPSLIPALARRRFVSWVATAYADETESRYVGAQSSLSVKVNYHFRHINTALEKWSYRLPAKIFALSGNTARRLSQISGLSLDHFEVLPYPIELDVFTPEGPRWSGSPGRYIMTAGRVDDERKNVAALVRVFERISDKHPDVHLVVAGRVGDQNPLLARVRDERIARVHFVGELPRHDFAAAYRSAEAFVMTSRQEGLGIVVLEGQASGLPVVIMRCGGSDELVDVGENGWLAEQGDEEGMAALVDRLLSDGQMRRHASIRARERVERDRSYEAFFRRVGDAYHDVFGIP